ncbi:DEAD-domain-containing protein [Artomyces pyxidatus]|uniref:DEAD-domain-containing protein n=1 Tax=Artomyces pyxidatus TaxID=48021 RepID=A0ACB8TER8_9AGAM|nr:DEAD-domain-containing protein [Artomyces pyxidatus]
MTKKRKAVASSSPVPSSKKPKTKHLSAVDGLPWKTVSRPHEAGLDLDEGILELEEVDDVEVVYEETEAGRIVRFNVLDSGEREPDEDLSPDEDEQEAEHFISEEDESPDVEEVPETAKSPSTSPATTSKAPSTPAVDVESVSAWQLFSLHSQLLLALSSQKFTSPTPIQAQTIPKALAGRDVIGVAETGSGKTLAYGLPILHDLLTSAVVVPAKTRRPLRALVLAPTRELALQVSSHLNACLNRYDSAVKTEEPEAGPSVPAKRKGKGKKQPLAPAEKQGNAPPLVSVAAIVGGMSSQKQKRILERGVDVLVATPGRLWDILEEDDALAKDVKSLRYLVLDEADRMIETGHFAELDNILRLTQRSFQHNTTDADFAASAPVAVAEPDTQQPMQTFVFSATLSKDLQRNLKKRHKPRLFKGDAPASTLDDLLLRLDFRDPEPEVVDISPEGGIVSTLKESKIECLSTDKDAYLYYFLTRYPGRTLVFLSSIDGIRRLTPLLELLGLPVYPLHSQLEQRQRLKNLDRFKSNPHAILLSTDIAARGLDIPHVAHVVHYQIPRSADAYVHRNGRTARAQRSGFSMLMCAPDERRLVRALLGSLGRQDSDIPELPIEHHFIDKLKQRLQLAKQIDNAQHRASKATHDRNWIRAAADAMDIELESECVFLHLRSRNGTNPLLLHTFSGEEEGPSNRAIKARNAKSAVLKAELKALLQQPLVARGVSTRYITSGSRPIVDDILAGEDHQGMVGVRKSEAGSDLLHVKKAKVKGAKKADGKDKDRGVEKLEDEEWAGFGS